MTNVFEQIAEWIKGIWNWIKSLFECHKRPKVRITILSILFLLFFVSQSYAQRTQLEYLFAYFYQPHISDNTFWTIEWHNSVADSLDIYKNDTLRVKIRNQQGAWVNYISSFDSMDTVAVQVKINRPYNYDVTFTFDIIARDAEGHSSDPSDSVKVHFIRSDINKIIDINVEGGFYIGDYFIDGLDLIELSKKWGSVGLGYRDFQDINGDTYVDGLDLIQISKDWGKAWTP